MAGICISSTSPNNCGHRIVTIQIDGQSISVDEYDSHNPLTPFELEQFVRLAVRRARAAGVTLASMLGRVVVGEEATNVKAYNLLGPGAAVTKTNIGTAYLNVCPGANGERSLVDFTGGSEFRIIATVNLVGTGPFGIRVVRDADDAVLFENGSIAQTGERELDTNWQPLPAAATGLAIVRLQAKSAVGADDPVFRRVTILVR